MKEDDIVDRITKNQKFHQFVSTRNVYSNIMTVLMLIVYFGYILLIAFNKPFLAQKMSAGGVISIGIPMGIGVLVFTIINTLLQKNVDDQMRGRVMGLYTLTFFGFAPFGNLAMGQLAEQWGMSVIIALSAACTFILAAIVIALVPRLRKMK